MCLDAHQHFFWKVRLHLGRMFQTSRCLGRPSEEGPVLVPKNNCFQKSLREICFNFFYCSHPDCLKLPHAEKQSENVEFKTWADQKRAFRGTWGCVAIFALGRSHSLQKVLRVLQFSPPTQTPIPTSLTPHTHTPPWRRGAVGITQGRQGIRGGRPRTVANKTTRVGCLCVCVRACTFF